MEARDIKLGDCILQFHLQKDGGNGRLKKHFKSHFPAFPAKRKGSHFSDVIYIKSLPWAIKCIFKLTKRVPLKVSGPDDLYT